MTTKSVEEIQTSQQTMNEEFGSTPETLGDNSPSQPIQGIGMSVKEYYEQFCIWISKLEAVNSVHYVDDDEWYVVDFFFGLKMDLMERVFRHKGIRRVSDAFRLADIEENSGKNGADVVFDEMSHPESEHLDEVQEAKNVGNEKSTDLVVQLKADHGKTVLLNADSHMPNKSTRLEMLNNSTRLVFTGLNSFPEKLVLAEFVLVKAAYQKFDKMPELSFVWPFEDLNGNKGSISLIDCVPRVFDPGSVTNEFSFLIFFPRIDIEYCKGEISRLIFDPGGHSVCYMSSSLRPIGKKNCALCDFWADELTSATFQLCVPNPCSRVSSLHHTRYATRHSLEPRKRNGKAIMTVFDPGGILVCYNGCDPLEHNRSCKCNDNQNDYDCWFDKLNVELDYKQTMIVIVVTLFVIVGLTKEVNDSHISRKVWAVRVSSWDCYGATELGVKQGIYNIEVDQVSAEQNMDMGSHLLPLTMDWFGKLGCDSIESHGAMTYIVSFSFDPGGSYYLLRAKNRIGSGLLLVHGICCWILLFDMPTFKNYCWATNMLKVLLIFHSRIVVRGNIFHDTSSKEHHLRNIISTVKAGRAAILYDWDIWNVCTTMNLPREYMDTEAVALNYYLFINQVQMLEPFKALIVLGCVSFILIRSPRKSTWNTMKQLASRLLLSLVALWASGCLHLLEAMYATQLNNEPRIELCNDLQVEFLAAFGTVNSWKGSGGYTTSMMLSGK